MGLNGGKPDRVGYSGLNGVGSALHMANLLKPIHLQTAQQRIKEADRQQRFHNLQKRNLPLCSLGEKPLRLLLDVVAEFTQAKDFIRIFPTRHSVKRYGHMVGIGTTSKSMSATQLVCLSLFNEERLSHNVQLLKKKEELE